MSVLAGVAATALAFGAAAVIAGFGWSRLGRLAETRDAEAEVLMAAGALLLLFLLVDNGATLRWRFAIDLETARMELPGVGLLLGLALLATLAGALLLGAARLAGPTAASRRLDPRRLARRALILDLGLCALAAGVLVAESIRRGGAALAVASRPLLGIVLGAAWLGTALALLMRAPVRAEPAALIERGRRATALAAALAAIAALASGADSWLRAGSYATAPVTAALSAALVGLAALQPTRLASSRQALLAAVLLLLLARAVSP